MKTSYCLVLVIALGIVEGGRVALNHSKNAVATKFDIADWRPNGYSFEYETSSGNIRKERGYMKTNSEGKQFMVTEGEYSYVGDDNQVYHVSYIADENGYRPTISKKKIADNPIDPPAVKLLLGSDNFVFEDDENIFTTKNPTDLLRSTSTSPPTSSAEYPFDTTPFPDEDIGDYVDNRLGLPPDLVGSLLG